MPPVFRLLEGQQESDETFSASVDRLRITTPTNRGHGKFRFRGDIRMLDAGTWAAIEEASRETMAAIQEAVEYLQTHPDELREFFQFPESWMQICLDGAPWWHLFARLDVFLTSDGRIQVCEINSDTPSGQTDMWAVQGVVADTKEYFVPGRDYAQRLFRILQTLPTQTSDSSGPILGMVYPTDVPEDLDLIRAYDRLAVAWGFQVVHGAPVNLTFNQDGRAELFGTPIDVMFRHYKTDWWGERRRAWYDSPRIPDASAMPVLGDLLLAEREGRLCIVNPFGAMLAQSKKLFAFLWERGSKLSERAQSAIHRFVPRTYRFSSFASERLMEERERWVLKSEFGCEGDGVVVGKLTDPESWRLALKLVIPERWVVQSFFEIEPLENGELPNLGVYMVGGEVAGLYARTNAGNSITDSRARVLPVVIERAKEPEV